MGKAMHLGKASMQQLGRMKAGSMNGTEQEYARRLDAMKAAGEVLWWEFEPVNLRITGLGGLKSVFYSPDFMIMNSEGVIEFHETKGFWTDDALVKIKTASGKFPFRFVAMKKKAKKDGGGWVEEEF